MSNYEWVFAPRFRRNAFGWRSDKPIERIKEALAEIRAVARKEPVLAAEGAIVLLEKLSPALMGVESSSGALGAAVNRAIEALVPLVVQANVDLATSQRWLERLWEAIQEDEMPYIEHLADFWGDLCISKDIASDWADRFLPILQRMWSPQETAFGYFQGTDACLSALLAAGRTEELLMLVDLAKYKSWHTRRWGIKALIALGRKAEAVRYAEASRGLNAPEGQIAQACEALLLSSGLADAAYARYGIEANQKTTYLATFRAIAKKYPSKRSGDDPPGLGAKLTGRRGQMVCRCQGCRPVGPRDRLGNAQPDRPPDLGPRCAGLRSERAKVCHGRRAGVSAVDGQGLWVRTHWHGRFAGLSSCDGCRSGDGLAQRPDRTAGA